METNNQISKKENSFDESSLPLGFVIYEDQFGTRKRSRYDLSLIAEFLDSGATPKEFSKILRDVHHHYSTSLIEDFMESDVTEGGKDVVYNNDTLDNLFHLKLFADFLDEIEATEIQELVKI